jgi:hypothetical protein
LAKGLQSKIKAREEQQCEILRKEEKKKKAETKAEV